MTTTTTSSYKRKPFVKKLVFKLCAGGLPDQLLCEYLDNIQFALVQAFEFSEEFDLKIEPDHSRAAFTPDWKNADRAYPTGRPFELKAWSTRAAQDLELTALAAKVVMPGYLALLEQLGTVSTWLPGLDFAEDQLALRWVALQSHDCDKSQADWVASQAPLLSADASQCSFAQLAQLLHDRRAELLTSWAPGASSVVDDAVVGWVSGHYVTPTDAIREGLVQMALTTIPEGGQLPSRYLAERLMPAGKDHQLDRILLQRVANGSLPASEQQQGWLLRQAEVHAPHCARARWASQRLTARAILARWDKIERRFAGYTQHDHPDPIPT